MHRVVISLLFSYVCSLKCFAYDLDDVEYDKMPPLFSLDDFNRCMIHNGTYCLIRVDLHAEPSNELMNRIINYSKSSHIKHYNHTYLEKGICVNNTCGKFIINKDLNSSTDLHDILEKCTNDHIYKEYGLQAKVSTVYYCNKPTDQRQRDVFDWIVLAVFLTIVTLNFLATVYDITLSDAPSKNLSRGQRIFLCFSLVKNWNHLISPLNVDPKMAKLQGINGMRVATSFPMVLGHVVWIYMMGFIDNPHDFERAYDVPHYQMIFNGMIIVQVFFVISGFLLIYNLEIARDSHKVTWKTIPAIFFHRFFRLTPPLLVMLAFTATWLRFMGSGPLWDRYVTPVVTDCRRWWWTHLLFINNYVQDNKFCAIQTWHIAADTQLFFVGIVIYILTGRRRRNLMLGLLMLVSLILPALNVYLKDLDAVLIKTPEFLRSLDNPNFGSGYVLGHNNISAFVLGMFAAYKLHDWQKKGVVFKGPVYTFMYRISVLVFILFFFVGNLFFEEDTRTPLWIRMLYQSIHRLIIGLPVAYVIIGMEMGFDTKFFDRIYNWRGFTFLGRLTYSVYLLHMNFIPVIAGSKTQLEHLSYLNMMITQLGIVALTYLIAIPFYLMVEAPINPLVKLMLMPAKSGDLDEIPTAKPFLEIVTKNKKQNNERDKEEIKLLENCLDEDEGRNSLHEEGIHENTEKKDI